MDKFMSNLQSVKMLFLKVAEAGLALVAFIVIVYLLLGAAAGPYVISVIANLSLFVGAVSSEAILGIAILAALVFFLRKKS